MAEITEKDIRSIHQSMPTGYLENTIRNWDYQIEKFTKEEDNEEVIEYFKWKKKILQKMIKERENVS